MANNHNNLDPESGGGHLSHRCSENNLDSSKDADLDHGHRIFGQPPGKILQILFHETSHPNRKDCIIKMCIITKPLYETSLYILHESIYLTYLVSDS